MKKEDLVNSVVDYTTIALAIVWIIFLLSHW